MARGYGRNARPETYDEGSGQTKSKLDHRNKRNIVPVPIYTDKIELLATIDGQSLHELIHEVKGESGLTPQEFFGAIYTVFLGKNSGPKVGWFLSTLTKDFLIKRLRGEE